MVRMRREIRSLGAPWSAPMLWYAKGVGALRARPITDKTSWTFLAAVHGIQVELWRRAGFLQAGARLPEDPNRPVYWSQCQHQSWYFWPWHRAYLWTFEEIVGAAIVALGGPADWGLPYWNYSGAAANAATIPQEFTDQKTPDGEANPLFVAARFGTGVPAEDADLTGITYDTFTGALDDPDPGVGGPTTPFSHSGSAEGKIENLPHDAVHDDIGRGGLMSDPRMAALDPIFWAHHANIDRLWEVWLKRDPANNANPTDRAWLGGPADRRFRLYDAHGADRPSNPENVLSIEALGYGYDDVSDPLPGQFRRPTRLQSFAARIVEAADAGETPMTTRPQSERLDTDGRPVSVGAAPVDFSLKLAPAPAKAVAESFSINAMRPDAPGEPDRVFLKLESVRTNEGSGVFDVYVRAPSQSAYARVGSVSLFGVASASDPKGPAGGAGITKTLEITGAYDAMSPAERQGGQLDIRFVPRADNWSAGGVDVGQVSLIRRSSP